MREKFIEKKFGASRVLIIKQLSLLLDEYREQGLDLTLRQLYYQIIAGDLLSEDWIDSATGSKNSQKSYKRLGDLRLAGLLDWRVIKDRGRATHAQCTTEMCVSWME